MQVTVLENTTDRNTALSPTGVMKPIKVVKLLLLVCLKNLQCVVIKVKEKDLLTYCTLVFLRQLKL